MAKMEIEKEKWSIEEIFVILKEKGMEIFSIQEVRRQYNQYDYETAWAIYICKEKKPSLTE